MRRTSTTVLSLATIGALSAATLTVEADASEHDAAQLTVRKEVREEKHLFEPPDESFRFELTGDSTVRTVDLKAGESHTWFDLPAGDYTLTEILTQDQQDDGWQITFVECTDVGVSPDVATLDLDAGDDDTCVFENFREVEGENGEVTVTKTTPEPSDQQFEFVLSDVGNALVGSGDTHTWESVPPDTYDLTETVPAGWTLDWAGCGFTTISPREDGARLFLRGGERISCTYHDTPTAEEPDPPELAYAVSGPVPGSPGSELYLVEPSAGGEDTMVGPVQTPTGSSLTLTDIALTHDGTMYGVRTRASSETFQDVTELYEIDAETATATLIGETHYMDVNGLEVSPDGRILGATTRKPTFTNQEGLVEFDPETGEARLIGSFGPDLGSSGDLAFGPDDVLYLSAQQVGVTNDVLATVDPETGAAERVSPDEDLGYTSVRGLFFDADRLLGVTRRAPECEAGALLQVDSEAATSSVARCLAFEARGATTEPQEPAPVPQTGRVTSIKQGVGPATPMWTVDLIIGLEDVVCPATVEVISPAAREHNVWRASPVSACAAGESPPSEIIVRRPVFDPDDPFSQDLGPRDRYIIEASVVTSQSAPLREILSAPPRPKWIGVGDSFSSGHHQLSTDYCAGNKGWLHRFFLQAWLSITRHQDFFACVPGDFAPNDDNFSWVGQAVDRLNEQFQVPRRWRMQFEITAKSGAKATDFDSDGQVSRMQRSLRAGRPYVANDAVASTIRSWDIVSITGGANDAEFSSALRGFYADYGLGQVPWDPDIGGTNPRTACPDTDAVYERAVDEFTDIRASFQHIAQAAQRESAGVRIVGVQYPHAVNGGSLCFDDDPEQKSEVSPGPMKGVKSVTDLLAAAHNVFRDPGQVRVDLRDSFGDRPVDSGHIQLARAFGYPHPSALGQCQIAYAAVESIIKEWGPDGLTSPPCPL